jgi:hypothetical protein
VGLVELLVALAISAALLTAVAVATDACFKAYGANQSQAQLMQRARLGMNRLITYIRSTEEHVPQTLDKATDFSNGLVVEDTAIEMALNETQGVAFEQSGNHLQMRPFTIDPTTGVQTYGTARVLLDGVGAGDFRVVMEPQRSAQSSKIGGNYDQLRRVNLFLTVRPGSDSTVTGETTAGQVVTLSTSVMPRRNFW